MKKGSQNPLLRLCFLAYCGLMLWLLFGRSRYAVTEDYWQQVQMNMNLTPFHTVKLYLYLLKHTSSEYLLQHAFVNLLGNVGMFIPLGIFLPAVFPKLAKFWKCLISAGLIICAVELTQLFTLLGSCDVDDLILNLLGVATGYWIFLLFKGPRGKKSTE